LTVRKYISGGSYESVLRPAVASNTVLFIGINRIITLSDHGQFFFLRQNIIMVAAKTRFRFSGNGRKSLANLVGHYCTYYIIHVLICIGACYNNAGIGVPERAEIFSSRGRIKSRQKKNHVRTQCYTLYTSPLLLSVTPTRVMFYAVARAHIMTGYSTKIR